MELFVEKVLVSVVVLALITCSFVILVYLGVVIFNSVKFILERICNLFPKYYILISEPYLGYRRVEYYKIHRGAIYVYFEGHWETYYKDKDYPYIDIDCIVKFKSVTSYRRVSKKEIDKQILLEELNK